MKWILGVKPRGAEKFITIEHPTASLADPFIWKYKGENYLFFEYLAGTKGVIVYSKIKDDFNLIYPIEVALEEPYHLSYPYIFEDNGNIYMTPESGMNHTIDLYICEEFPNKWKKVKQLVNEISAGDTNIQKYGGWYWLITTNGDDNLIFCLKSRSLMGEWEFGFRGRYPSSRGAGRMFYRGTDLIRPVQFSDDTYGKEVIFKKITLPEYSEEETDRFKPDWDDRLVGTHTYNFNGDFIVVDGKIKS